MIAVSILTNKIQTSYFLSTNYKCLGRHVIRNRVDALSTLSCFMTIFANFLWNLKSAMTQERFRNVYLMFLMCFTFLFVDSFFFTYQPAYPVNTLHHARISDWILDTGNSYSVMGEQTEYCTLKPLYMYLFDGLIKIVYQIWSIKQAFDYFIWFFWGVSFQWNWKIV